MTVALDLGEKKVGLAVSKDGKIVFPRGEIEKTDLISGLKTIKKEEGIKKIVIGLPLSLSGKAGAQAKKVKREGKIIGQEIGILIVFFDERLSTKEAEERGGSHSEAARIILEAYLDKDTRNKIQDSK